MSYRSSFSLAGIIAFLAWIALLLFTHFVPPSTLLSFVTFFVLLCVALIGTFTPISYVFGQLFFRRKHYTVTLRYALRQGTLLTLVIIVNLILRALHSWNILMALVIVVIVAVVELLALARK